MGAWETTQCLAGRKLGTYGEERSPAKNITQIWCVRMYNNNRGGVGARRGVSKAKPPESQAKLARQYISLC